MKVRAAALILVVLAASAAGARAQAPADSLADPADTLASPARPLTAAQMDSIAAATRPIRVVLEDGSELRARRVSPGSMGGLRLVLEDGRESIVAMGRVRRVEDGAGRDRTHEVVVDGKGIRMGGPPPRKRDDPPPTAGRWLVSAHASKASPVGNFENFAADGFAADLGVERRTRRKFSYGLQLQYAEFGGSQGTENLLAQTYAGAVDELEYRMMGVNLFGRWFIVSDRRLNPFVHLGLLGAGKVDVKLSGPQEEANSSDFSWTGDVGLGLAIRVQKGLDAEIVGSYASAPSSRRFLRTDSVSLNWEADLDYLRLTAGIVHRFGASE